MNRVSESLDKLHNRILSDAKLKADETIREAQAKADQIIAEARQRAQKEADELLAKAKLEAEAVRRSILSSKVRANRLRVLDEKNRIVQEPRQLFQIVDGRLQSLDRRVAQIEGSRQRRYPVLNGGGLGQQFHGLIACCSLWQPGILDLSEVEELLGPGVRQKIGQLVFCD